MVVLVRCESGSHAIVELFYSNQILEKGYTLKNLGVLQLLGCIWFSLLLAVVTLYKPQILI